MGCCGLLRGKHSSMSVISGHSFSILMSISVSLSLIQTVLFVAKVAGLIIMLINVWVKSGTMLFSQHSVPQQTI